MKYKAGTPKGASVFFRAKFGEGIMRKDDLTQEELKRQLHYDKLTGVFTRLVSNSTSVKVGDIAGCIHTSKGRKYSIVKVNKIAYKAHRLAFLYVNGNLPINQVDHIDSDGINNKWGNLRSVTNRENCMNQRLPCNNTSGVLGVQWHNAAGKWVVSIRIKGESKYLGLFFDKQDAIAARQAANIKYGFHDNHGANRSL